MRSMVFILRPKKLVPLKKKKKKQGKKQTLPNIWA